MKTSTQSNAGGARAAEEPAGKCQWARGTVPVTFGEFRLYYHLRYTQLLGLGEQGLGKGRTGCTAAPWSPRSSTRPRGKSTSHQCNRTKTRAPHSTGVLGAFA